jgi:hypothetical protein
MTQMFDSESIGGGGDVLYPANCVGNLLIVWSVGYIDHAPTQYTVPGKLSDVIVVDVVNLDEADDDGYQGKLYRQSWWRNNRLIGFLKNRVGRPKPVLARMGKGAITMGNAPYELHLADSDPESVDRAKAWFDAHPDFRPTVPMGQNPEADRRPAEPVQERKKSQLEVLAEQAQRRDPHQQQLRDAVAGQKLPPPRPGAALKDSDIPF